MKTVPTITSLVNPKVKEIVKLQDSRYRREKELCVVEGLRAIETFLAAKKNLESAYCTAKVYPELLKICPENKITIVSDTVMKKMSSATTPSGFLALFHLPHVSQIDFNQKSIVLAQINDPGNMGTLMRTAAAMSVTNIIMIEGTDPWGAKVIQASAGALAWLTIFSMTWKDLLREKQDHKLCALVVRNGKNPEALSLENVILVIGNEAFGLPEKWQKDCELLMTLPMSGHIESLNAAVAGSIALYLAKVEKKSSCQTLHPNQAL